MSTRERFFPLPGFVPNPNNPLQRNAEESAALTAADKFDENETNQSSGLNGWRNVPSRDAIPRKPSLSGSNIVRPGTSDPFRGIRMPLRQEGRIPVLAPAPKRLGQVSPPLTMGDVANAATASEDTTTILQHDTFNASHEVENDTNHITPGRHVQVSKNPFMKKPSIGPQRVLIENATHYRPRSMNRAHGASPIPPNDVEDQGSLPISSLLGRKRMREPDEVGNKDTTPRQPKRFKNDEFEVNKGSYSPQIVERPSSGLSSRSSGHLRQRNPEIQGRPQPQHFAYDQQGPLEPAVAPSNGVNCEHSSNASSDVRGLDRLLGPGSNDYLDQRVEEYGQALRKWSECSLEEWKAGAEEISKRFTNILDFAKIHVDKKLKAYSEFNAILESHEETLCNRSANMELAQRKVVKESGNVLG